MHEVESNSFDEHFLVFHKSNKSVALASDELIMIRRKIW